MQGGSAGWVLMGAGRWLLWVVAISVSLGLCGSRLCGVGGAEPGPGTACGRPLFGFNWMLLSIFRALNARVQGFHSHLTCPIQVV